MTADLWGGGERVPESDRYPLLLLQSCSLDLTCSSIQRRAVFPASVVWALCLKAGCPVRMSEKRCALLLVRQLLGSV
ncbi:unnamed protein product, partial [Staurois parvus]